MLDRKNESHVHDEVHARLMKLFLTEKRGCQIEVPFNYYGSRGFIDVLEDLRPARNEVHLFELKPNLSQDIGEMIRQLKGYKEFYPKAACDESATYLMFLVSYATDENIGIIEKYKELFIAAQIGIMLAGGDKRTDFPRLVCILTTDGKWLLEMVLQRERRKQEKRKKQEIRERESFKIIRYKGYG